MITRNLLSIWLALSLVGISRAQSVDPDFDTGSAVGWVYGSAPQPNGGVLICGSVNTQNAVARLFPDGFLDASFNPSGISVQQTGTTNCLAVQADGKVLIGGVVVNQTIGFVRLNADGSMDSGFNQTPNNAIQSLAVQADGKVLVAGRFLTLGGQSRERIARLNSDGTLDTSFNAGALSIGGTQVRSVAPLSDGRILIGGLFSSVQGQPRSHIAMLNADASLSADFYPVANDLVIALQFRRMAEC